MKEQRTDIDCKCPACLATENGQSALGLPFRESAGKGRSVFHLVLHLSLPFLGVVLIGFSWWALVPVLGFLFAYLANSFILCPTCAYHHAGVRFCGCYPKSVFPYRRYLGKRWGNRENVLGRTMVIILTVGPTIAVLAAQGHRLGIIKVLVLAVLVVFLTSTVSCPDCRQQDVCALGRLTATGIKRKNI
jgi:hypothetical protein